MVDGLINFEEIRYKALLFTFKKISSYKKNTSITPFLPMPLFCLNKIWSAQSYYGRKDAIMVCLIGENGKLDELIELEKRYFVVDQPGDIYLFHNIYE